jgi:hypothetical protein
MSSNGFNSLDAAQMYGAAGRGEIYKNLRYRQSMYLEQLAAHGLPLQPLGY